MISAGKTLPCGFDRSTHVAPRLTNQGLNMDMTADKLAKSLNNQHGFMEQKVPTWWDNKAKATNTKTELLNRRRSDRLPHASMDLDGDGVVGMRDYRVAKLFDKDGKGRLDES